MKTIIVSAAALATSGALTILREFTEHAATLKSFKFIIFIPENISFVKSNNITYIPVKRKNWISRIYWDCYGFKRYVKCQKLVCDFTVSLQNTSINIKGSKIIYIHQPLPFVDVHIPLTNLFNLKLWLYKNFYSFFIFLFSDKETSFIVQTNWLKQSLVKNFNINESRVFIIKPKADFHYIKNINKKGIQPLCNILYPATPVFYKNHLVILKALGIVREKYSIENIILNVTFSKGDYTYFDNQVIESKLTENICYLGYISQEKLYDYYNSCSFMVFPSYVETCGLPLLEAASQGIPIIASDLPYAQEMLDGYNGVLFVNYDNPLEWAEQIYGLFREGGVKSIIPLKCSENSDWNKFNNLIEGMQDVQK